VCESAGAGANIQILSPFRVSRPKVVKAGELERAVELCARKLGEVGAILVILDADDDLPCRLGPLLLERAQGVRPGWPIGVVVACREFESWFLAGVESLRGLRNLSRSAEIPPQPEAIRGAKEWLRHRMENGYAETLDQPAFAHHLDLAQTRARSPSFDKLVREVVRLCCGSGQV
jgi:hypothetical protein